MYASRHAIVTRLIVLLSICSPFAVVTALAQMTGPPPELRQVIDATVDVLKASDEQSLDAFTRAHLSPDYRDSMTDQQRVAHMQAIRKAVHSRDDSLSVEADPDGARLVFGSDPPVEVRVATGPKTQWKISSISVLPAAATGKALDPRSKAMHDHAKAIEKIGNLQPEVALEMLEKDHFSPGLFKDGQREVLLGKLAVLKRVIAAASIIDIVRDGDRELMKFRGDRRADVAFGMSDQAPFLINSFDIIDAPVDDAPPIEALAWGQLEARFEQAEKAGFSGVVVARQNGKSVIARGFGHADGAAGKAPALDTVFDIGSMPIDFTRIAILTLNQQGKLGMDDRIDRFFPKVPADKASITIAQLMGGGSGLANFHHRDTDADRDLSWIDRDTAVKRIVEQPLLFAPGASRSHSHSAFGLLAAIVEISSGQSYGDFMRRILFEPAGMTRTGFYGESLGLADNAFAVGLGNKASEPNIPPRWGPTSWLVMGSGGMVSSVADMQRGFDFLRTGKLLEGKYLREYLGPRIAIGGTDRGFLFLRVAGDDDSVLFLASNSQQGPAGIESLLPSLIELVRPGKHAAERK